MQESFLKPVRLRTRCGLEGRAPQKLAQPSNIPGHRSATGPSVAAATTAWEGVSGVVAFGPAARRDVARSDSVCGSAAPGPSAFRV